ncbi:DUF4129 domain-containing protein [Nocardia brasiliensis]|uniref:DUF4129 domain-containing protein n=1 Tax=Nocardia brasiliensis TaxID=37326 RepID=A0A6G9XJD4_NOCBR|nr:DUF4129 domain-containing protein [Nocardia brasiliensis]QIS01022.1 DUF4129 domain-containing protein [Nocardia brasiliensis]
MNDYHGLPHDADRDQPPGPPRLGTAADHRAAAEQAAQRRDFDAALRERFRAVLRGLEQRGVLEVRRSRTARETADDVTTALPTDTATELHPAAHSFDEVVYGGRRATEDEYRRLEYADRFSESAPPPAAEPIEVEVAEKSPRTRRQLPPLPELLRDPRFWGALAGIAALLLLLYGVLQSCGAPTAPNPPPVPTNPPRPDSPDSPDWPGFGAGDAPIWERLPAPVFFGALQFLIAAAIVVWWRARRRGALVPEPRPVEVAANELLAGQAALYRRSKDYEHVAAKLRGATLRRIRPTLGMTADTPPDRLLGALAARIGTDPAQLGTALYGPVPDVATLELVAAQLEWIEAELG